jgi:adenylate cyclase
MRVKRIWNSIVWTGVRSDLPARKVRFIRATNAISVLTGVWLLTLVPLLFPYLPAVRSLLISTLSGAFALFLTPLFNKAGWYRFAPVYSILTSFALITFNSLNVGHDSWNDLFLLAAILTSFYYFESLYTLIGTTALGLLLFIGVEFWYSSGRHGLLEGSAAPAFFDTAKNASIYNLVILTIGFAYYNRAILNSTQRALDREAARSERLLLNILPGSIADRLKSAPDLIADRIAEASILFADIVGFTEISRKMDASHLVGMLNEIFVGFDRAAKRLGLEKIKTIGDAYMVAAGLPEPRPDHAEAAIEMAMAMQGHLESIRAQHPELQLRIGIHTGAVVAGVIGENKFTYDLWGDNVNIASRMESHGLPGRIQVTESFARALAGGWEFEDRGLIEVKGQGPMRTFLLKQ